MAYSLPHHPDDATQRIGGFTAPRDREGEYSGFVTPVYSVEGSEGEKKPVTPNTMRTHLNEIYYPSEVTLTHPGPLVTSPDGELDGSPPLTYQYVRDGGVAVRALIAMHYGNVFCHARAVIGFVIGNRQVEFYTAFIKQYV